MFRIRFMGGRLDPDTGEKKAEINPVPELKT